MVFNAFTGVMVQKFNEINEKFGKKIQAFPSLFSIFNDKKNIVLSLCIFVFFIIFCELFKAAN